MDNEHDYPTYASELMRHKEHSIELLDKLYKSVPMSCMIQNMKQVSGDVEEDMYDLLEDIVADEFPYNKEKLVGRLLYDSEREVKRRIRQEHI